MTAPLRVLFVEDSDDDVALMLRELSLGGYEPDHARVETASAMRAALEKQRWDVVIADYTMPRFSAPEALGVLKEKGLDIPCIVVSGSMDEAIIVSTMRFGAQDYLLKGNLARLAPAIDREPRDAKDRALRRRAERALEDSEAYLRAVFEHVPDGILTLDDNEQVESINAAAAAVFGYSGSDIVGTPFRQLLAGKTADMADAPLATVLQTSDVSTFSGEVLARRKNGATFPLELSLGTMRMGDRTVWIGVLRDVTERKRAEAERTRLLKQAEEAIHARDEFLSLASHELRTPFTPLQIEVQSIVKTARGGADESISSPRILGKVETIARQVGRIAKLIDNLLDISRITAKRLDLEPDDIDLNVVVWEVAERFRAALAVAKCPLVWNPGEPLFGHWDSLRLDQVVTNLMSNAIKYGPGKPIEITATGNAREATLTVKDHGIGIAPSDRLRIFERFERAVSERHYGGFGLGLWIVRQIVNAQGGEISVSSTPGQGSTFTVVLPRNQAKHE